MKLVSIDSIREAAQLIRGVAHRTPLEHSWALSDLAGGTTYLKCENLQRTGAFKIRGAYNFISKLSMAEQNRGVVTASAGNHAQGVALAASLLGVKATVFMPQGAAIPKIEATSRYGAEVILEGSVYNDASDAAMRFSEEHGAILVHPYDHPDVIAGQGTLGLELLEQLPEVASIVVPVGGGGLISGIAAAVKASRPEVRVIGVEPDGAANMTRAVEFGRVVTLDELSTVADGLATKKAGELTFHHVRMLVDEMITVSDDEIAEGLLLAAERAKMVVEPAGAVGLAALMFHKGKVEFPAIVVLSGGNIDPLFLLKVIRFGMSASGRYFSFRTRLSDRPGELFRLLGILADIGSNVVGVEHHREGARLRHLGDVEVAIQVETKGLEHVGELQKRLSDAGYVLERL